MSERVSEPYPGYESSSPAFVAAERAMRASPPDDAVDAEVAAAVLPMGRAGGGARRVRV